MNLSNPWGLLAGLLVIPVVLAHILKPARRLVEVSSTWLWRAAAVPVTSRKPWEKLRWSVPLILQLLGVMLLALGLAQPTLKQTTPFSDHTVFIFDTSASMGATDVLDANSEETDANAAEPSDRNRLDVAKDRAKSIRRKLPSGGLASITTTTGDVLLSTNDSERDFDRVVDRMKVSESRSNISKTALVSQGLQTADRDTGFVLLSDGQLSAAEQRLLPPGLRFEPVGKRSDTVGISQVSLERTSGGLAATVTIRNRTNVAATMLLALFVDDAPQPPTKRAVAANSTATERLELPAGKRVRAALQQISGADYFALDDSAYAAVGQRKQVTVRLVSAGPDSVFLTGALRALPYIDLLTSADAVSGSDQSSRASSTEQSIDVTVFDGVDPPKTLTTPAMVFAAPKGFGPVVPTGFTASPALSQVDTTDPLLSGLDLSEVLIESAQTLQPGDADILAAAAETPLILRGRSGTQPFVYWGFEPEASNMPLDISFPVIIDRIVSDLSGSTSIDAAVEVGSPLTTSSSEARRLTDPSGTSRRLPAGDPGPTIDRAGFWSIESASQTNPSENNTSENLTIAANIAVSEQIIEPSTRLGSIAPTTALDGSATNTSKRPLLRWLIAALLCVALAEWLAVRRRVGVSQRQWRAAQVSRGVVAATLLAALVAPRMSLPTSRVATVFAVDASDSLSPAGRRQAIEFVEAALAEAPKSARAGVVVFGGNARVTAATQRELALSDTSPVVDATRTDLASALRLAAAVSPSDAARRVILISDGRRTDGDETVAAEELRRAGIRIDTALVGRSQPGDVAVASFTAPARANTGERVTLRASLQAAEASPALVTLKAAGEIIDQQTIQLEPGANPWSVDIVAPVSGVIKYSLEVKAPNDTVIQNDLAFSATSLEGPNRVLVLKGASNAYEGGNGSDAIIGQLTASGLDVISEGASEFSGLDDLAGVSAVVMVDVHRRELNADQVRALTAGVRELGIGLTVVGGGNSFGSGGYLGSEIEALLPVISEVNDPKRETNLAMAIIIDTSGSMSEQVDGKRTALDLAKAAANGAAKELGPKDYIGVVGVDDDREWVLDVQVVPKGDGARKAISKLQVGGGTVIEGSLSDAAARMKDAKVGVRHILVLSDGYTSDINALIQEAAKLRAAGYTVSAVGAGPSIEPSFSKVAIAGGGRFVPGDDFKNLPAVFSEETQTVARNLVVEGDFIPRITSAAAPVRDLATAPAIKGYQAGTLRPTAQAWLRVGDFDDPLIASWQAGLGKVTTWASDGGQRWANGWSATSGSFSEPFWPTLVKDSMLKGGTGSVRATVNDDTMTVRVSGADWGSQTSAVVTVRGPDGTPVDVAMRRTSDGSFVGTIDAPQAGGYAVGANITSNGTSVFRGGSTAIRGYSSEYRPGNVEKDRLVGLSTRTGGRGIITAAQAFDKNSLTTGRRSIPLSGPLLGFAAFGWLLSIALWRIQFRSPTRLQAADDTTPRADSGLAKDPKLGVEAINDRSARRAQKASTVAVPVARELTTQEVAAVTPPQLPAPSGLDQLVRKAREERSKHSP